MSNSALKKYFKVENFDNDKIEHFFFTKNLENTTHNYSYESGQNSKDAKIIANNKKEISKFFRKNNSKISFVNQCHGKEILLIDSDFCEDIEYFADSIVTNKKNIILAIYTGDCIPILFADPVSGVIGATHAGWRGAKLGIIEDTIGKLLELGASSENLTAVIGPCIRQNSYEVGQEFYDHFLSESQDNMIFFKKSKMGVKYFFDLVSYVTSKLEKFNVKFIDSKLNNFEEEKNFFSYRRDYLKKMGSELDPGRIVSAIILK